MIADQHRHCQQVWIDSANGFVEAALFWPDKISAASTSVLIVPGIAHEERTMVGGVVALAEALADNGLPTLLMSLHGSCQSAGRLEDPEIGQYWRSNIQSAFSHLRSIGSSRVIVVGVRLGFLLAASALADEPVAAIIAWAPVLHGKSYVRELKLLQRATGVATNDPNTISIGGFSIPPCVQAHISSLDITAIHQLRSPVVVLRDVHDKLQPPCLTRLQEEGHILHEQASSQITAWLFSASDQPKLPFEDVFELAAWCRKLHESECGQCEPVPVRPTSRSQIEFIHKGHVIRETFVEIGPVGLTGVLSEPLSNPSKDPVRLLMSTVGPGRTFTDFARDEASRGKISLRFDFAGFGTSVRGSSPQGGELYTDQGARDVRAAISYLKQRGFEEIYGLGFCAGAWSMLQAGYSGGLSAAVAINVALYYQPSSTSRLFIDRFLQRLQRRVSAPTFNSLVRILTLGLPGYRKGNSEPVDWLTRLCETNVAVLLAYSDQDLGLKYLQHWIDKNDKYYYDGLLELRTYKDLGHLAEEPLARAKMFSDIGDYFSFLDSRSRRVTPASLTN